jgi:hypothetical protein
MPKAEKPRQRRLDGEAAAAIEVVVGDVTIRVGPLVPMARLQAVLRAGAPHRPGRANFPHPVLRARASLTGQRIGERSELSIGAEHWF